MSKYDQEKRNIYYPFRWFLYELCRSPDENDNRRVRFPNIILQINVTQFGCYYLRLYNNKI